MSGGPFARRIRRDAFPLPWVGSSNDSYDGARSRAGRCNSRCDESTAEGQANVPAAAKSPNAPADEYFGPFKYSAISVRMKINALGRSYHERWSDDASIVHDALLVESSFRAWAAKYPKDRWIAPTAYHLAQLYQDVQTQDARNHARAMYDFLAKNYPSRRRRTSRACG